MNVIVSHNPGYTERAMLPDPAPLLLPPPRAPLEMLWQEAAAIAAQARAANTRRAYASDWRDFARWCAEKNLDPLPAADQTVVLYLTERAQRLKLATLVRRLAAIGQAHRLSGFESPLEREPVRLMVKGLRRKLGVRPEPKRPLLVEDLHAMVAQLPDEKIGARDRALLLIGFLGAFRRSELVGIEVSDVEITPKGLIIQLGRSKTDPEGQGRKVGIPRQSSGICPAEALERWLAVSGIRQGPIFRPVDRHGNLGARALSGQAVALIVKRWAQAAGLDARQVAGHSLRAGLATAAAIAGKSERAIMQQTGHRSVSMLRRYIRDGELFRENAAQGLLGAASSRER